MHSFNRGPRSRFPGLVVLLTLGVVTACETSSNGEGGTPDEGKPKYVITEADTLGLSQAIFAGGCFWCIEVDMEKVDGVRAVISGYIGGDEVDPTYDDVSYGRTGHTEAVLVTFDPDVVTYEALLRTFWVNHDPTTNDRQFCDRGLQYRPGIFYLDDGQKRLADESMAWAKENARFTDPILTEITRAGSFWPAEVYHQDFHEKSPTRYKTYRIGCRRDARLRELWGELVKEH